MAEIINSLPASLSRTFHGGLQPLVVLQSRDEGLDERIAHCLGRNVTDIADDRWRQLFRHSEASILSSWDALTSNSTLTARCNSIDCSIGQERPFCVA